MLGWTLTLLVITLIATMVRFAGSSDLLRIIAKVLPVTPSLFLLSLICGRRYCA